MILCVGVTPAVQRVMVFRKLGLDAVNRAATTLDGAAGKAVNVAKVLHALGEQPLVTGFLGGERGKELGANLAAQGVATEFITVEPSTRQCITVLDQGAGTVTELVEESRPVTAADYDRLWEVILSRLPGLKAVVLSGTITPGGPIDFYARCTRRAKGAGCLVAVDAQGPPLLAALAAKPDLVKPNRTELGTSLGRQLGDEQSVFEAMMELHSRGLRLIVVTDGGRPMLAFDGSRFWRIRPPRIQPVNPIGSGDACTAAIVSRLLRGDDLAEACRWGAAAGAANALTLMPGEVHRAQVKRFAAQAQVNEITCPVRRIRQNLP